MKCKVCGEEIPAGNKFCAKCGTPVQQEASPPAEVPEIKAPQDTAEISGVPESPSPVSSVEPVQDIVQAPAEVPPAYQQPVDAVPPAYQQSGAVPPAYQQSGTVPPAYQQPGAVPPAYQQPGAYGQPGYTPQPQKPKKKLLVPIIAAAAVLVLIVGVLFATGGFGGGSVYNDCKNVYSGGAVAQQGNTLFYIDDNGYVYSSKLDGSSAKIIVNQETHNIAVSKKYLYYIDLNTYEMFRIKHDGSGRTLVSDGSVWCYVYNETLYSIELSETGEDFDLVSMKLDGKGRKVIFEDFYPNGGIAFDGNKIYIGNYNDDYIYEVNLNGSGRRAVAKDFNSEIDYFVVLDGCIYYVSWDDDCLYQIPINTGQAVKIMDCSYSATINVYNGKLYLIDRWDRDYVSTIYVYNPKSDSIPQRLVDADFSEVASGWFYTATYVVGDYLYFDYPCEYRFNLKTNKVEEFLF